MASYYSGESDLNLDPSRLIELTETDQAVGVKDQATMDALSEDAQDFIDAKLRGTYAVPFPDGQVPRPIRRLHARVWRYYLFEHRDALQIPDSIVKDFERASAELDDYGNPDGGAILDAPLASAATGPAPNLGTFSSDVDDPYDARRKFGRYRDKLG